MTIQLGTPGNSGGGGGGGGGGTEITQAGGRVTVEADGSISIRPLDGEPAIRVFGTANGTAPHLEFGDDSGSPNAYVGAENGAGTHLSDSSDQSGILAAAGALFIGIFGELSTFDITTSGLEIKAPRVIQTNTGPNAWGQAFVGDAQNTFGGIFSATGAGDPAKMRLTSRVDGDDGDITGQYGLDVGVDFQTQAASETIARIAQIIARGPAITNNLGGGGVITDGAALLVEGPSTGAANNYAILVEAGLSRLQQLLLADVGPHGFGVTSLNAAHQYQFGGSYTSPGSDFNKVIIDGLMTGASGTQRYRGHRVSVGMATQATADTIFDMDGLNVAIPNITDNLTGGVGIVQASSFRIEGAPTEGNLNYALLVEAGLSELRGDFAHLGTNFGVYSTAPIAQQVGVGVDAASIHAACVALGLFTA